MKLIKFSAIPRRNKCLIKVLIPMIKNKVVCMLTSTLTISLKCSSEAVAAAAASTLEVKVVDSQAVSHLVVVEVTKTSPSDSVDLAVILE